MRPFIGWSATVVITLGRSRMGSSCPLLSSPTGNAPAFPKLALIAHSRAGGLGASFGSAIAESLLPEKAIHLSRNTVPPPAVRRCNSFCFYGIAAAIGLRHTNGNIDVTISNIRPECFSFSLPLLQSKQGVLARFSEKCFARGEKTGFFQPVPEKDTGDSHKNLELRRGLW